MTLHPKELIMRNLECLNSIFILICREKYLLYSAVLQFSADYQYSQWKFCYSSVETMTLPYGFKYFT